MTPATILEHDDIKQPVTEWALDYGITPAIIIGRLERGETIADAINTPMHVGHREQKLASHDMEKFITQNMARWKRERGLQHRNIKRRTGVEPKTYTFDGKTLSITEWSAHTGLLATTIRSRLWKGWDIASALSLPVDRHGNRQHEPGVVSDLSAFAGTGAGSTVQETPNITFSGIDA